jgi:hypothetical protein
MSIATMHMAITTKPHTITSVLLGIASSFSLGPFDKSQRPHLGKAVLILRAENPSRFDYRRAQDSILARAKYTALTRSNMATMKGNTLASGEVNMTHSLMPDMAKNRMSPAVTLSHDINCGIA